MKRPVVTQFTHLKTSLFVCFTMVFSMLLTLAWPALSAAGSIYPVWDIAADMLLTNKIRAGELLFTGHYSRYGFNHPGPIFFYWNALFEEMFGWSDLSRLQVWTIATIVQNSLFITIASAWASRFMTNTWGIKPILIFAATTVFFLNSSLTNLWMPYKLIAPYLAFFTCLLLLNKEGLRWLTPAVVLVGILIHGYITMPIMTIPFLFLAGLNWLTKNKESNGTHAKILMYSAIVAIVFALPILFDLALLRPSNISKIIAAQLHLIGAAKPSFQALAFFFRELSFQQINAPALLAMLIPFSLLYYWKVPDGLSKKVGTVFVLTLIFSLVFLAYHKSVEPPLYVFVGQYAVAIVALIWGTLALTTMSMLDNNNVHLAVSPKASLLGYAQPAALLLWFVLLAGAVKFASPEDYSPPPYSTLLPIRLVNVMEKSYVSGTPIRFGYTEQNMWPIIAGILLELERRGIPSCTTRQSEQFVFTARKVCGEDAIPSYSLIDSKDCGSSAVCEAQEGRFGLVTSAH